MADIFYTQTCPNCQARFQIGNELYGRQVRCGSCGQVFYALPPVPPVKPTPAPPEITPPQVEERRPIPSREPKPVPLIEVCLTQGIVGVIIGCVVGYFAAHHFAFFGGWALMGEPYSPARNSLVPGHMLLCALLLGAGGVGLAILSRKLPPDSKYRNRNRWLE
jgi:predicted Zn finger-like uncharacterized protein